MKDLLIRKIISEVIDCDIKEIPDSLINKEKQWITENIAIDGKTYYWYCSGYNDINIVIDMNGTIIFNEDSDIEDILEFFNAKIA